MSQKYTAVHFFEPQVEGFNFHMSDWPSHVTLLPRLTLGIPLNQFLQVLQESIRQIQPFSITIAGQELFGPSQQIPVQLVQPDPGILNAHTALLQICIALGCSYDEPNYNGAGYRPHVTVQKNSAVQTGQTFLVNNLSIVDMLPNEDITQRKIVATYNFGV